MKTKVFSKQVIENIINKSLLTKKVVVERSALNRSYLNINRGYFHSQSLFPKPSSLFLSNAQKLSFCSSQPKQTTSPVNPSQVPAQNLEVVHTQEKIQEQNVQVFHAKGTLSIMSKVPGVKQQQSGDLYVLMFTCGKCNAKQIKSFTKNAYHKGVVLVRCVSCDNIHLVADNLKWFEDTPVNIETLHKGQVKRVHDQQAISMFLNKAFGQQQQLIKSASPHQNKQSKQDKQTKQQTKETGQPLNQKRELFEEQKQLNQTKKQ